MKKLYLVTKIDENDNVTREYISTPSKRDKVFKNPQIVKAVQIDLPIKKIEKALQAAKLPEYVIKHVITDLTTK